MSSCHAIVPLLEAHVPASFPLWTGPNLGSGRAGTQADRFKPALPPCHLIGRCRYGLDPLEGSMVLAHGKYHSRTASEVHSHA